MSIQCVQKEVLANIEKTNEEFHRLFHGRGGCFKGFEFLSIDSIDRVLFVVFFYEPEKDIEKKIKLFCKELFDTFSYAAVVLQRRYNKQQTSEVFLGALSHETLAKESGLVYGLNFLENQNIGFFGDMKNGRAFVAKHAHNKTVLNLFSYTCSFSVVAIKHGANKVVNVDMSKAALTQGRANHHLNGLDTSKVVFMPYNILKSWNRIKKGGPYDLVIIDPPSFQKGSFALTKDYVKIIKRLSEFCTPQASIMACLNDPKIKSEYLIELFSLHASEFEYVNALENLKSFKSLDEQSGLKCLIFSKVEP